MQAPDGSVGVPLSESDKVQPGQDQTEGEIRAFMAGGPAFNTSPVIEALFTYHEPTGDQPARYRRIRAAAKLLAYEIDRSCEPGPDRTAAIRHVREAVMTANATIATNNAQYR